jgi:alpha-beta hydrolase superfamily lysophospholipase
MNRLATGLGKDFASETATVNGIQLHYVRGGKGPAVVLIHGFPQDWFEYYAIMPRLSEQFNVIAIDLRGVGGSTSTLNGYDAANMAEDVHQLAAALKLERVYIVGHDIGGQVAYALSLLVVRLKARECWIDWAWEQRGVVSTNDDSFQTCLQPEV